MRVAFNERDVDGFLAIDGVPTVAFAVRNEFDPEEINHLHNALWNQGLASVLVVHLPMEVQIYSLWQKPGTTNAGPIERDRRLIQTLQLASDATHLQRLVPSVESGEYFEEHQDRFDPDARVDRALLNNLREARDRLLEEKVPDDVARTLILQVIFIAFLEDRGIIDSDDFEAALGAGTRSLVDTLNSRSPEALEGLFSYLRDTFNGDVFFAPGVFEAGSDRFELESRHLGPIIEFREGRYDMETGQAWFWPYDFRFIPVELISAIYDRFLNEDDKARKDSGAYFTPRFLADLVVDQVWNAMDPEVRANGFSVLDPACGSAIFLVRLFQKMIEEYRRNNGGNAPEWFRLRKFVEHLHGWDIQESAVRIGVFSLYVALLEQVYPPAIRGLKAEGKFLPRLLGRTLCCRDFFQEQDLERRFHVIVGNPPWVSRKPDSTKTALDWCRRHGRPVPNNEIAWAFLWKSAEHLYPKGRIAFLLPAMGILLNHSKKVNDARRLWLESIEVLRIINFADVCFQLFDGAKRPTILAIYKLQPKPGRDYDIEYWVPKTHRLLSATRVLMIPSVDRSIINMSDARHDPVLWKKRMWATNRDMKLLGWLSDLPKLGRILITYQEARRRKSADSKWIIGQGFQPHRGDAGSAQTELPLLSASEFRPWVVPTIRPVINDETDAPVQMSRKRRQGFIDGFEGPHILIPQGVKREHGLLRAAYVEQSVAFRDSIQAIRFTPGQEGKAKILTAVLNSSLAAWCYFHTSANFGADRAKVDEAQLLDLPFPSPEDTPDAGIAHSAGESLVQLVDEMLQMRHVIAVDPDAINGHIRRADELVFDYYGLTQSERTLVRDTVREVIPSMQPAKDKITRLMDQAGPQDRKEYANTLLIALGGWMRPETSVAGRLMEGTSQSIIELRLVDQRMDLQIDTQHGSLENTLREILRHLPVTSSRNIELHPDLKIFIGDFLYLVKPTSKRYWLRATALNDADQIAGDLIANKAGARRAGHEHYR